MGKERLDLSTPQIAGSALAAASAAVAASFLGVHGTVIGAALASVGTTVGGTVYTHYIKRTRDRFRAAQGLITEQSERQELELDAEPVTPPGERGLAAAAHATVRDSGPAELPHGVDDAVGTGAGAGERPALRRGGRPRWVTMAVATGLTFALSMGGILTFELLSGKPLNATVQGRGGSGTSWGGTVDEGPADPGPSPVAPSEGPAGSATPRQADASQRPAPAQTGPAAEPTGTEPAAPPQSGDGSTAAPTAGPDTGDGTGEGTGDGTGGGTAPDPGSGGASQ
ncbi:hypothetical protein Sru01_13800 [Sphaerisporangium rufum]|uniref:Uncharacterized protein n=1 Tax=Sphaerisporangium rufum TaxID=1381558 RepID=A0A919QYY9_9ACTN|nr:hypothetical protein [Sphaerisporangium rufum]GII76398.1 hypothetical protein Sru01_13800 [Sphaerisporangium rufum]